MKKMLMLASVASMIDQFNMPNIEILRKQGYEVHVAANFEYGSTSSKQRIKEFRKELTQMGITYYHVDFSRKVTDMLANVKAYRQIKKLMITNKYSFIHCHSPIGGVCGRLAAHNTNTPVIYTAHGFHFYKGAPLKNWVIYYPVEKLLSKYTDCLITINKEDYNCTKRKRFKAAKTKLVNGVGINLDKFKPQTKEKKGVLRDKYGYKGDDFILIYVGELSYRKNQNLLINVVGELKQTIPNLKLLLVGTGSKEEEYKEQIKKLGVEDQVKLLGYRDDIGNLMMLSDIAVSSSRQEGLPVNIMEAMATGLPLVVTDCRGNEDLVTNEKNGYVVGIDDSEGFAQAIKTLYGSAEIRKQFSDQSLIDVEKYSLSNITREMEKLYLQEVK